MVISFLGVRTDRHGFRILTWKHVGTQKISTQSSKLVVSCRSLYASLQTQHAEPQTRTKAPIMHYFCGLPPQTADPFFCTR